jgi:hypothetical protein
LNGHGTVGLFGELAGFDGDLLVAQRGGYFFGQIDLPAAAGGTSVNPELFGTE